MSCSEFKAPCIIDSWILKDEKYHANGLVYAGYDFSVPSNGTEKNLLALKVLFPLLLCHAKLIADLATAPNLLGKHSSDTSFLIYLSTTWRSVQIATNLILHLGMFLVQLQPYVTLTKIENLQINKKVKRRKKKKEEEKPPITSWFLITSVVSCNYC